MPARQGPGRSFLSPASSRGQGRPLEAAVPFLPAPPLPASPGAHAGGCSVCWPERRAAEASPRLLVQAALGLLGLGVYTAVGGPHVEPRQSHEVGLSPLGLNPSSGPERHPQPSVFVLCPSCLLPPFPLLCSFSPFSFRPMRALQNKGEKEVLLWHQQELRFVHSFLIVLIPCEAL